MTCVLRVFPPLKQGRHVFLVLPAEGRAAVPYARLPNHAAAFSAIIAFEVLVLLTCGSITDASAMRNH